MQFGEGKDSASRIGELGKQLEAAKLELREAENARDSAKKQFEAERSMASGGSSAPAADLPVPVATPEIDARLDAQRAVAGCAVAALHGATPRCGQHPAP